MLKHFMLIVNCILVYYSPGSIWCSTKMFSYQNVSTPATVTNENMYCIFQYLGFSSFDYMSQIAPSAVRYSAGKLKNHRLDFGTYDKDFSGPDATVVQDCGYEMWGAIYFINESDFQSQLGFAYNFKITDIEKINSQETLKCWIPIITPSPQKLAYGEPLPNHRRPSKEYIDLLVKGYTESGIPEDYIHQIENTPTRLDIYKNT